MLIHPHTITAPMPQHFCDCICAITLVQFPLYNHHCLSVLAQLPLHHHTSMHSYIITSVNHPYDHHHTTSINTTQPQSTPHNLNQHYIDHTRTITVTYTVTPTHLHLNEYDYHHLPYAYATSPTQSPSHTHTTTFVPSPWHNSCYTTTAALLQPALHYHCYDITTQPSYYTISNPPSSLHHYPSITITHSITLITTITHSPTQLPPPTHTDVATLAYPHLCICLYAIPTSQSPSHHNYHTTLSPPNHLHYIIPLHLHCSITTTQSPPLCIIFYHHHHTGIPMLTHLHSCDHSCTVTLTRHHII
jgi:hypothetical protein